ncbi:MAG: GNAT family N-acetyltransferase [Chitinophagaceae bacterium]|nr:GNAT family N-acetyltransferase [Chitinophagaceae bacterium]
MLQLNFNPFPVLETSRLILRRMEDSDAPALFELRSNAQVMQYVNRPIAQNIDDAKKLIATIGNLIDNNDAVNWGMALKENPSYLIGNIGIFNIKKEDYRAEFGYLLQPDYWRKGLMQEAIEATINFAFNTIHLHSLEAKINPLNAASAGILEKNNFVKEAHFKEDHFWEGQFLDTIIYSLLNKK